MTKSTKTGHQRFVSMGIPALQMASQFLGQLESYIDEMKDPSLLAMTKEQAQAVLNFVTKHNMHNPTVVRNMQERVRISERQGQFSLQRKRELREQRKGEQ